MAEEGFKRKLTAILSADVVRYSALMDDNEAETIRTFKNYCSAISTLIGHNRGRLVDIAGDNLLAAFADERYEDACYWGRKTIQQNPRFPGGHRLVAVSCGQLGRMQEAASGLKELLRLMPGMTAADVRKQVPFKRSSDMERYIDGLRKAGLSD